MANEAPREVVAGSGTIYHAPVGTAFPDVDATRRQHGSRSERQET